MCSDKLWSRQIHHRIKPNSSKQVILIKTSSNSTGKKLVDLSSLPDKGKVAVGIDKNSILSDYEKFCLLKGITTQVLSSINAGELEPSLKFPPHHRLVNDCKMKLSLCHQYQASIISLDNVIVFVVKNYKLYFLEVEDLYNLSKVNRLYGNMVNNVLHLRLLDFSKIKNQDLIMPNSC
jgi:hypothetical protein